MKYNFLGEVLTSIDDKERIVIPSKYRDLFDDDSYLTKGCEGCISIFPSESWENYVNSLIGTTTDSIVGRKLRRAISSKSNKYECDKSGRVKLPHNLIELAGIKKQCMIVGAFDHLEIWDLESWNKYISEADDVFEDELENVLKARGIDL